MLTARGRVAEYTSLKKTRTTTIFDGCGFGFPPDLSADRLERFLESLRTGEKRLSIQTTNDYLQAVSQFCNWMVENERLERNPFVKVKKGNPERDRRHVRRFLCAAELQYLVSATRASATVRKSLTGEARGLLYATGAYSGYRAKELAALVPESFQLTGDTPTIELSGEFTKNGKDASQPIPKELAETLQGFIAGRTVGEAVWPGTWIGRSAEMIQADAEAAGVALTLDTKDGVQVLDFHSLRGTFATLLDSLDISLKGRQELMRHSDPRLTMNRYTRAKLLDLGAAVQNLPKLNTPTGSGMERAALRATGTDGGNKTGAVPDAVDSGSGRLRLRMEEETEEAEDDPSPMKAPTKNPCNCRGLRMVEDHRRRTKTERGGFEPPVGFYPHAALAKRCDDPVSPMISSDLAHPGMSGAAPGAAESDDQEEFASLIAAWPELQAPIRAAMLALVRTAAEFDGKT